MLQHEPEEQTPATPAAQRRVTADELAQAVNALEADKDEAARHLAGTVPIGEVVAELKLVATPEEIWAQVQSQRAQAAAQEEAARARPPVVPAVPLLQNKKFGRRLVRGWRDMSVWLWILFWCSGGAGLFSVIHHLEHPTSSTTVTVNGDNSVSTYVVHHQDAVVDGDGNKITLRGDVRDLKVEGDKNTVTVIGTVEAVSVDSDGNTVHWTKEPAGKTIQPVVNGDDNHVGLSAP